MSDQSVDKPGVAKTLLAVLAVLAVVAGVVFLYVATRPEPDFPDAAAPTSSSAKPGKEPAVGDCMRVTGAMLDAKVTKVDCTAEHSHVVASLQRNGEDCGTDLTRAQYARYRYSWKLGVCLVPVFVDGQCYRFQIMQTEIPKAECAKDNLRVKVLKDTVKDTDCGEGEQALVYPEIRTTYCFSLPT